MPRDIQVAAYYFPNYHFDPRNAQVHGPGWNEWELVRRAVPRFPGHAQPRAPLWGYENEADRQVMQRKIDAAANNGLDAFIFDWYWYNDGPFLERGLEEGFLGAPNSRRIKFAVMWANHDWLDIHPASLYACSRQDQRVLYPGKVTYTTFKTIVEHVIERYFKHPSYWKIAGAPYFSIYDIHSLVSSFGGLSETRAALEYFRARVKEAGFPDLHLNQVLWNQGVLPGETAVRQPNELLHSLGFDSFTSYVWIHHASLDVFPQTSYMDIFHRYLDYWERAAAEIDLPYFPNATMGWDSSPRTVQSDAFVNAGYPFTPVLEGNTPENFRLALAEIKKRLAACAGPKILTVNAWNEWTEGSYLEPDEHFGWGYLEAIRGIFG